MVATLVFVLAMLAFGLLVVGERMGLAASLGVMGVGAVLACAMLALGLGSVTSRLARFGGSESAGVTGFAARVAVLLVLVLAHAPMGVAGPACWAGFSLGFVLAHLGAPGARAGGISGRLGYLLPGLAFLALGFALFRPLAEHVALTTGWGEGGLHAALCGLMLVVLLPGGAVGLGRLQRVALAMALVLALLPFVGLLVLSALERADPLGLEALRRAVPEAQRVPPALAQAVAPLVLGGVAGMAARGTAPAGALVAGGGWLAGLACALALVLLHGLSEEWLAQIVVQRISGVSPSQWPIFVFEEPIQGWMRLCGHVPTDAASAARACGLASPTQAPRPGDLTFLGSLSAPALAQANGLPVLLGYLWGQLPVLLGLAGLAGLFHGGAMAVSEAGLYAGLNPSGLRSWRLAMARLTLCVVLAVLFLADRARWLPDAAALVPWLAALGVAGLVAQGLARWRPPKPASMAQANA